MAQPLQSCLYWVMISSILDTCNNCMITQTGVSGHFLSLLPNTPHPNEFLRDFHSNSSHRNASLSSISSTHQPRHLPTHQHFSSRVEKPSKLWQDAASLTVQAIYPAPNPAEVDCQGSLRTSITTASVQLIPTDFDIWSYWKG